MSCKPAGSRRSHPSRANPALHAPCRKEVWLIYHFTKSDVFKEVPPGQTAFLPHLSETNDSPRKVVTVRVVPTAEAGGWGPGWHRAHRSRWAACGCLGDASSLMQQVRLAGVEMGPLEGGPELGKSRDGCPVLEVRLGVVGGWCGGS